MTHRDLIEKFIGLYGGSEDGIRVFEAPGRVNLIGEHTDYNGGYVFPAALTFVNTVIARKRCDNHIKLAVTSLPDRVTADIANLSAYKTLKWGNYQLGVAYMLQQAGYEVPGCDILYHGTVPYGSGLSSSAAIEVVMAIALLGLSGQTMDKKDIARLCQKAENEYCGMNCGIMDQFASAFGKKDNAVLLDCNTLEYRYVPLNLNGCSLVLANSNKPHNLIESKYNERRSECERAVELLKAEKPGLEKLCTLTPAEFDSISGALADPVLYRRARHAVYENARTLEAVKALESDDLATLGELMRQSHESMRDDYEITGVEMDTLYELGRQVDGCYGVRMTGGGFGGCTVAIVRDDAIEAYKAHVGPEYERRIGYAPEFYICAAGEGGREITEF